MSKRLTRVLSLVLTLVMFLSVSTPAFAIGGGDMGKDFGRDIGENEIRDFEPEGEIAEEEELDYFQTTVEANGSQVTVEAPMGALPTLAELRAEPVAVEDVRAAVESVLEREPNILLAMDISFWLNGIEIEPEEPVRVKISAPELDGKDNLTLIHIPDAAAPETVQLIDEDQLSFALGTNEIAFQADSFSIYVVDGGEDPVPRHTYNFVDGNGDPYPFLNTAGQTVTSQIIKNGESLQEVPAPGLLDGNAFNGWYYYENGTYGAQVVFGEPITVTENKEITIKAHYGDVIYVTFYQFAKGEVVLERMQIPKSDDGKYHCDLTQVSVPAPSTTLKFMGWSLIPGTDDSEVYGDVTDPSDPSYREIMPNADYDGFTENAEVYPVYYTGIWVVFVSAGTGMGASYVESYFLPADSANASAAKPADPTMTGYAFDHWSTAQDSNYEVADTTDAFDFNTSFDDLQSLLNDRQELVLYGHWKGGDTKYIVVFWKQNVNDMKNATTKNYDYFKQEGPVTGRTGSNPANNYTPPAADHGFVYVSCKLTDANGNEISGLAADQSSILNVYYDRQLITLKFYKYGTGTTGPGYNSTYYNTTTDTNRVRVMTGLYGQPLSKYDYTWPSDGAYRFYYGNNGANHRGMSYLGQFVLPDDSVSPVELRLFYSGSERYLARFYLQNADGSYPTTGMPIGILDDNSSGFSFSDKYDGFKINAYRFQSRSNSGNYYRGNNSANIVTTTTYSGNNANNAWTTVTSTGTAGNRTYTPAAINENYTGSTYNRTWYNVEIRYERELFTLKYVSPIDESEVLDSKQIRYGAALTDAKPGSGIEIDLGRPGYEWNGKWYKDKACTVEFNFSTEVMPFGDTKVYAGMTPLYYFIKIDPNGGQLQTGQATWRWVTYGDDTTYTYDNIERNYIEYKEGTTPYYYYYDEFEVDRREDIWNYAYMAINPRTAYYTSNTVPYDWDQIVSGTTVHHQGSEAQDWLDTTTKYSYEKDAYQLIGWYDVTDGTANMKPFKTGTAITRDTIIQAQWRRTGKYTVVYEEAGVDENGTALVDDQGNAIKTLTKISDSSSYADQSDAAIGDIVVPPPGYTFVGWLYDGDVYSPGDIFVIHARLSDDNSVIHIYPVLEPVETLPVEVIDITYHANNGVFTAAADTEINEIISKLKNAEGTDATYKPEKVVNDDGSITIKNLKINESFDILSGAAVANGVVVNGNMVPGRGYRLVEWNTKADGSGKGYGVDVTIGVDGEDPVPNDLYAIWEKVFYVYHSATGKFDTIALTKAPDNRVELTTGFDKNGTVDQYTSHYYGGYAVYAKGDAEAAGLTFENGDVKSGTIAANYWTRFKAAKSGDDWNTSDTGAVYYLKEVPTSYLATPIGISIRATYGEGPLTAVYFLTDTDTNIYRTGGVKLNGTDTKGAFSKTFTLKQNGTSNTKDITANSQFGAENGYLAVVNVAVDSAAESYSQLQGFWTTYDGVNVYGIQTNIKDSIVIGPKDHK